MILGSTLQLIFKKYSLVSFLMSKKNIQDDLNRLLKQSSFFQLHIFMDLGFLLYFIFLICFSQSSELQQTECRSRYENCGLSPLQYSCLENPMDWSLPGSSIHGTAKSRARLSDFTFTFHFHALEKEMATQLQCSCLENPRDGGAWWAAVYGVAHSRTQLK